MNVIANENLKTIGIFNDSFPPLMDGVAMAAYNYAHWLYTVNQAVCVVTPKVPDFIELPFPVYRYPSLPLIFRKPYRIGLPELSKPFLDTLERVPFGLIHAHCPFTSGHLALKIAKEFKIPLIATFHSKYKDDFERIFSNKKIADVMVKEMMKFFEQADEVWIPQAAVEDTIREYGFRGRVVVMPNGTDYLINEPIEQLKQKARIEFQIPNNKPVFLFVGQHIWEKNPKLILEGLAKLTDVDFQMFFVGTGYAEDDMKDLAKSLLLNEKVKFVGQILDRQELQKYYAVADLFLFPSLYDNAPLVVREAATFHTPAVLARNSTASEIIIDRENGFLTENDSESFANLLRRLVQNPMLIKANGQKASETIARTWQNIVLNDVLERYNYVIYKHNR